MSELTAQPTPPAPPLPTEVASLMVPMAGRPLLVPNLAVAEIVPFERPIPEEGHPVWHLGFIGWRGQKVPVISLMRLRGEDEDVPHDARIAVFNGIGGSLPFFGVISHGIPRLVRVRQQDLESTDGMYTPYDDAFVAVGGELAVIPNLPQIESTIAAS